MRPGGGDTMTRESWLAQHWIRGTPGSLSREKKGMITVRGGGDPQSRMPT